MSYHVAQNDLDLGFLPAPQNIKMDQLKLNEYCKNDPIAKTYMQITKHQAQPIAPMIVNGRTIKKDSEDMAIYGRIEPDTSGKFVKAVIEQSQQKPKGPYEAGALVRLRMAAFSHELFVVIESAPHYVQVQELGGSRTFMYPNDYVTLAHQKQKVDPVTRPLAVEIKPGKEVVAKNMQHTNVRTLDTSTTLFDLSHNKTVEEL